MRLQRTPRKEAEELKELGFNVEIRDVYVKGEETLTWSLPMNHNERKDRVSAPSVQIAYMWLDTKGIHCGTFPAHNLDGNIHWKMTVNGFEDFTQLAYETRHEAELEALRAGIKILKDIIKEGIKARDKNTV
jgi:hypothetical protein